MEDATGDALVAAVLEEYVATAEEAKVYMEVALIGGKNLILPSDNTLVGSGRFLANMRRARYYLTVINLNRSRSMWSKYRRSQSLISSILRPHRTLVRKPQGRKRFPVTV